MKDQEVIDVVAKINLELFDGQDHDIAFAWVPSLTFSTDGTSSAVNFGDFPLWDTEDHDCPYIDEGNTQEPLEECLRRRLRENVEALAATVKAVCGTGEPS